MNGSRRIIEGLKQAIAGDMTRVTIEGQVWERILPPWDRATSTGKPPKEVMQDQRAEGKYRPTQTDAAPPQPAPSPAGAINAAKFQRSRLFWRTAAIKGGAIELMRMAKEDGVDRAVIENEQDAADIFDDMIRFAPPVTEEMVIEARAAIDVALDYVLDLDRHGSIAHAAAFEIRLKIGCAKSALTAALTDKGK